MGERALQDESGRCEEQIAVGRLGPQCLTWLAPMEKNWGVFLRSSVYSVASETIQNTNSPGRWMFELQASDKPVPLSLRALTTGKKNSFVKLSQVWSQVQALPPQIPLPSRQGGLHGAVMKWSLMPQVWRKAVQSLERPVSSWDPGLVAQGGFGQQVGRTSYLLQLSLTISYSEMREQWGGGHSQGEGRPGVVSNSAPPPSSPASFIQS